MVKGIVGRHADCSWVTMRRSQRKLYGVALSVLSIVFIILTGCGVTENHPTSVFQITLAIYPPLCVDVPDGGTLDGALVQGGTCVSGQQSQYWHLLPANDTGGYSIVNLNSGLCLSVLDDPDTAAHQKIVLEGCHSPRAPENQTWNIVKAPGTEAGYQLISNASNQCLDIPNGRTYGDFPLQQYYCQPEDPAQGWTLSPVESKITPSTEANGTRF
jgi:hypothetical protein